MRVKREDGKGKKRIGKGKSTRSRTIRQSSLIEAWFKREKGKVKRRNRERGNKKIVFPTASTYRRWTTEVREIQVL